MGLLLWHLIDFVDKRGRKVEDSAKEDLSNFYELSDEGGMWLTTFISTT